MTALANAGLPMIALIWPASWILLVPVIAIEWGLACRTLKVPAAAALEATAFGNFASTLIALPVTWALLLIPAIFAPTRPPDSFVGVVNNVILHSAWLVPWTGQARWMVPAAALFLCIPFYFASVGSEFLVAKWTLKSRFPDARFGRWAWTANGVTYGAIAIGLFILFSQGTRHP